MIFIKSFTNELYLFIYELYLLKCYLTINRSSLQVSCKAKVLFLLLEASHIHHEITGLSVWRWAFTEQKPGRYVRSVGGGFVSAWKDYKKTFKKVGKCKPDIPTVWHKWPHLSHAPLITPFGLTKSMHVSAALWRRYWILSLVCYNAMDTDCYSYTLTLFMAGYSFRQITC